MRTRLAILLALVVALAIGASALLTSQIGVTEWPAAPAPDTASRLITPSEAAGRVADSKTDEADRPAERAERRDADRAANGSDAGQNGTTPVSNERRSTRRSGDRDSERRNGGNDAVADTPASDPADAPAPQQPSTPAAEPITTAPANAPEGQHSRDDEVPATPDVVTLPPSLTPPAPTPTVPDDDERPNHGGRRRGPLRNLLGALL